jgi:hypothetical protein
VAEAKFFVRSRSWTDRRPWFILGIQNSGSSISVFSFPNFSFSLGALFEAESPVRLPVAKKFDTVAHVIGGEPVDQAQETTHLFAHRQILA